MPTEPLETQESPEDLAPMKAQVYKDPRPVEYFARFHERSRTRDPDWVYEAVRIATTLYAWIFFRTRGIAAEKVRGDGSVILAPNHFSFMDHFFLGVSIRRKVRFMAKSQLFQPPMQWIYTHGGVFPVRRGFADEEAFITARGILEGGVAGREVVEEDLGGVSALVLAPQPLAVGREALVEPDVLPAVEGHQVAEPLVRQLVHEDRLRVDGIDLRLVDQEARMQRQRLRLERVAEQLVGGEDAVVLERVPAGERRHELHVLVRVCMRIHHGPQR